MAGLGWGSNVKKTTKEAEEHQRRVMLINNSLADAYKDWFGWPEHSGFGRYVALGEYIVELCENEPHDEWFDAAKTAYLKWKETHHITTTPPKA
jgi:hypothetical protein